MRLKLLLASAAVAAGLVAAQQVNAAPPCTTTWSAAGDGSWQTGTNWDNGLPGIGSVACIPPGRTVTYSGTTTQIARLLADGSLKLTGGELDLTDTGNPSHAAGYEQTSGILGGNATLELTNGGRWAGGTMQGDGVTVVDPGTTLTLDQFGVNLANARLLDNQGTMLFATATSGISGFNTARIFNESSGVMRKTVGSSTASMATSGISAPVENDGKIESVAALGTLNLTQASGGTSTGTYGSAGAAGIVGLAGSGHTLGDGAKLLDGSLITGNVDVVAAAGTPVTAANASMTSGIIGGDGVLSIAGPFRWAGGSMNGSGITKVQAGQTMTLDQFQVNLGESRVLDNLGTMLFATATGGISGFNTAKIVNESSGVMRKTVGSSTASMATSGISAPVKNDGKIESIAALGTLNLTQGSGGTSTGTYGSAAAAGVVQLAGSSTHTLGDTAKLLDGAVLAGNDIAIPSGTVTATNARMTTGTLGGNGTLSVSGGSFTWSGGATMEGAGLTRIATGATGVVAGAMHLADTRRMDVAGLLTVTGDNFVGFDTTTLIHVLSGGTIRKTGGTGVATIAVPVQNDGVVETTSGTLTLGRGAPAPSTGTFHGLDAVDHVVLQGTGYTLDGAHLGDFTDLDGDVAILDGQTLAVPGEIYQSGGTLTGNLDITGKLHWSDGAQAGGTTTVGPTGQILVENTCFDASLTAGRRLVNQGLILLTGDSGLSMFGDPAPVIENSGTIRFDNPVNAGCSTGISGDGVIHNTGTLEKIGAAAESNIGPALDNDGTVRVTAGLLRLNSNEAFEQGGTFTSTGTGSYVLDDGVFVLGAGAVLGGNPQIGFGELRIPADTTVTVPAGSTMRVDGGTISGPGTLRVLGTLATVNGTQSGGGTTLIEPGGAATLSSSSPGDTPFLSLEDSRSLVNRGTMTVTDGTIVADDGGSILNSGTLEVSGTSELDGSNFGFGSSGLIHNVGTLRKTGTSDVQAGLPIDNDGTIEVAGGSLDAENLLNYSTDFLFGGQRGALVDGTYIVRPGAALGVPGEVSTVAGRVVLDGAGSAIQVRDFGGGAPGDALATLHRIAGNGALELSGGRSLSTDPTIGTFSNGGVLRLGPSSTFSAAAGYSQPSGGVLRTEVPTAATAGKLAVTGAAALGGRFDVVTPNPPNGAVVTYGSHTGTFGRVTGTGFTVTYDANAVNLHHTNALAASGAAPPAATEAPEKGVITEAAPDVVAATALTVRGPWEQRGAYLVATRRGATLVRRGVSGRGLDIVAATGPRAGAVKVTWAGRTRTISLRAAKLGRRTIRVVRLAQRRKSTVVVRTRSARRVAIASLVVRR